MHPSMILGLGHDVFECRWYASHRSTGHGQHLDWHSVDITVQKIPPLTNGESLCKIETLANTALAPLTGMVNGWEFMSTLLSAAASAPAGRGRAAKLIVPRTGGYIVRSDIIPLRMVDCSHVLCTTSFADPQQWFSGMDPTRLDTDHLRHILPAAAGGIILDTSEAMYDMTSDLDALEDEIRSRLSFPWLLKERRPRQTLAFVGNYLKYPGNGGTGANHYSTAQALDINIVVLDAPGCWLEDEKYADLRGAFLPLALSRDDQLPARIIAALSQYEGKIDGITTFHESLSAGVARAAQLLSLPTSPPEALVVANDKYKASVAEGRLAYLASSVDGALEIIDRSDIQYPLMLKPCRGGCSEGVCKVDDTSEVIAAVREIDALADRHGAQFVIEEFCDGPEVDVNMVLYDGEVLFVEICDDFPKQGDPGVTTVKGSRFLETAMVHPSKLPPPELNILSRSLHQSLLRLGFRSGVFHLEARVKNSAMSYVVRKGIMDLEYLQSKWQTASPSSWLIEINSRPPGKVASDAVEITYGIDYVGLGLLFPLNDKERIKALTHPFAHGPQYWCQAVCIPVEEGGIFDSDNVCDELRQRRPDLAQHLSVSVCCFSRGDVVPSPSSGITAWIAWLNVFSRVGRAHLLEVSECIRQEIRYSII